MKRNKKSKRTKAAAESATRPAGRNSIAELAAYLREVKDVASKADAFDHAELEQIVHILDTLQEEGIQDAEEIKDYFFDYRLATEQWQKVHEKYEKPEQVHRVEGLMFCPHCKKKAYPRTKHCGQCGKALSGT